MSENSDWRRLYRAAMWELDPRKLPDSIAAARSAITQRRKALEQARYQSPDQASAVVEELLEIGEALSWLKRRENTSSSPGSK